MEKLKIGVFAFTKASWLTPKIENIVDATVKNLRTIPDAEILFDGLVCDEADSIRQAERFAAERVDAVVMYFVTFPAGAMIPAAATRINVPILLLANPEVPGPGKLWEQNSFCGANMAAHGMNRLRKRYSFTFAAPDEAAAKLAPSLAAVRAVAGLKNLKIGLAGGRVPGFYTSNFDELQLRRDFGTTVEVLELLEVSNSSKSSTPPASSTARNWKPRAGRSKTTPPGAVRSPTPIWNSPPGSSARFAPSPESTVSTATRCAAGRNFPTSSASHRARCSAC